MRHKFTLTHRETGIALAVFALVLLALSVPQTAAGWLTAPEHLDHTRETILTPARAENFETAMRILPQAQTAKALTYAALNAGPLATPQRMPLQEIATQAVTLSPGDPYNWYFLAAAVEPEIFNPTRAVLFDQALTMSMLTGPHTRDLILPRLLTIAKHWDVLSDEVHSDWEDQIISLWATAPADLRSVYLAMPADGRARIFATLDEIPGESVKFNQYLDHPDQPPAPPMDALDDGADTPSQN